MRIELIELSENNLQQCFDLNVASDQKQYRAMLRRYFLCPSKTICCHIFCQVLISLITI